MQNIPCPGVTLFQFCVLLLSVDALVIPQHIGSVGHRVYREK